MAIRTIVKKIVLGTPVRSVTGAQGSITSITEFNATNPREGHYLIYDSASGKYVSQSQNRILDSADVALIAGSLEGLDSGGVRALIDSDYVQLRFASLSESNGDLVLSGDLVPDIDSARSLGAPTKRFKELWLSGETLYIGSIQLQDVNGSLRIQRVNAFGVVEEEIGTLSASPGGLSAQNLSDGFDVDLSGTTQQTLDTISITNNRSAKYFVQMEDNTNNVFGASEVLLIHDSANVYLQEFGRVFTDSELGTFDASIDSAQHEISLLFTPSSSTVSVKAKRLSSGI